MNGNGQPVLTAAEIRAAEQALFASGIPEYDVMVRAGRAAADIVWRSGAHHDILVLCGPGNNGGDGYVIARALKECGVPVRVAALAEPVTESAKRARADYGGEIEDMMTAAPAHQLVDALFGTGLTRGLDDAVAARLAELAESAGHSYAVDLPSGVATDDGVLLSPVPHYDLCISLGQWKRAHMLRPAVTCWGAMVCCDIGIDAPDAKIHRLAKPRLSSPADGAHKYTRGLVVAVAGEMAGASALAAEAAARGGAGYVRLAGAQAIVDTPHAIVRASLKNEAGLTDARIAALLIGPGLGRSQAAAERLGQALAHGHPAVFDADALWHLAHGALGAIPEKAIVTPHAGEFAQLFPDIDGTGTVIEQALEAARTSGAVVLLKGPTSVVASPDGSAVVADRATSWLSTAGTGDVLAGLCAARLAVSGDPFAAACEALWLHGEAARRAGPAFIADDLLRNIGAAFSVCL
ncbi:MAG: NAD(P)H-hydrate dehydratase [Sphingobium sp.]